MGQAPFAVADEIAGFVPRDGSCVETRSVGLAERASLAYFAGLQYSDGTKPCRYLLIQDYGNSADYAPPDEAGWHLIWNGRRRPRADDRLRLYGLDVAAGGMTRK